MRDERVDRYIEQASPLARPILERIRDDFHRASARIEEDIKWGVPAFVHEGIVGGMAAFQKHVSFGFWRADELEDPEGLFPEACGRSLFTVKVAALEALPPRRVLQAYVKQAVRLNAATAAGKAPRKKAAARRKQKPAPVAPPDLAAALERNTKARRAFEGFPPGAQREYVEWIESAQREATRAKRLATTVAWLAEGKRKNWRYERR